MLQKVFWSNPNPKKYYTVPRRDGDSKVLFRVKVTEKFRVRVRAICNIWYLSTRGKAKFLKMLHFFVTPTQRYTLSTIKNDVNSAHNTCVKTETIILSNGNDKDCSPFSMLYLELVTMKKFTDQNKC